MSRTYEAQYDAGRGEVVLVAQEGFNGDRYAVTMPATSKAEADEHARAFVGMYRGLED